MKDWMRNTFSVIDFNKVISYSGPNHYIWVPVNALAQLGWYILVLKGTVAKKSVGRGEIQKEGACRGGK